MRNAAYVFGPIAFLITVLVVLLLLLRACAVVFLLFGVVPDFCAEPAPAPRASELDTEQQRSTLLKAEIRRLERELLARANCPVAPPPPPPEPEPERAQDEFDRERWEQRDLSVLEGCWLLDSDYRAQVIGTGEPFGITHWRACFDANGNGTGQRFETSLGPVCEGPQRAEFDANGALIIRDIGDVPCTQNFKFLERTITCALNARNRADCVATDRQTEDGGSNIKLRREQ